MDSFKFFLQPKAKIYLPRYFNCLNSWVIEKSNKLHTIKLNSSYGMFWLISMTLFCSCNELMGSNHQTTNSESTNCFNEYSLWFLFQLANWEKNLFWTYKQFVLFFNCSNWEKFKERIGENKIRCLVVWSHELVINNVLFIKC